jgi:type I inositol polyphosphate 5-phosphatase IP5P1/2
VYNNKHINIITCLCRCDRILSYGKGTRLLSYKRAELTLSDHRPVTAFYISEVEVLVHRKFQRALKFTNAEVEDNLLLGKEAILKPLSCETGNAMTNWI